MDCNCLSNFLSQMTNLRDNLVVGVSGLPNQRSLILRHRSYNDLSQEPSYSHTIILPLPIITLSFPRLEALDGTRTLKLATGKLQVKGISKSYSRQLLERSGTEYFVDATLTPSGVEGGFQCDFDSITENTLTWEITLNQRIGDKYLYET
jgi:hypothetical protein